MTFATGHPGLQVGQGIPVTRVHALPRQARQVISPTGKSFTSASIGSAIAVRAIMVDLRAGGDQIGGAAPFSKQDRSRFLQALDEALVKLSRV